MLILTSCFHTNDRPAPLSPDQIPLSYKQHELHTLQNEHDVSSYSSYNHNNIDTKYKIEVATPIIEKIKSSSLPSSNDEVIEEVYIPSALKTTPIDEIEIVKDKPFQNINNNTLNAKIEEDIIDEEIPANKTLLKIKVKAKDTLYSIAKNHNVKVYELAIHNNIKPPFILKTGSILEIPNKDKVENPKPETISNMNEDKTFIEEPKKNFIIVKKGDTIYSIAKSTKVPLKDLILRNKLTAPFKISIGDKILIPNTAFHLVKKKDTIYSISKKYGVSLNSLVKLNKIEVPYTLLIGQKVLLPASISNENEKNIAHVIKDKSKTKIIISNSKSQQKEISTIKVTKEEKLISKNKEVTKEQKEIIDRLVIKPDPLSSRKFKWPTKGTVIAEYNIKTSGLRNNGINISAVIGTPVFAANNGVIAYAGNELKGLGNLIIIKHDKNYMTIYAHNDEILVKKGDKVNKGSKIATVGKTGRVSTPQLHFEIRYKTKSINPRDLLERK